jgi:16S rRNA U516 pseudouridylate synthase RsuA-like enzyme
VRVRIGDLRLGNLKPKEWRYLTIQEVAALKKPATVPKSKNLVQISKTGR